MGYLKIKILVSTLCIVLAATLRDKLLIKLLIRNVIVH